MAAPRPAAWRLLWALPLTLPALLLLPPLRVAGARARWVDGALECAWPHEQGRVRRALDRLPWVAITLGHVVLAASPAELERTRAHERVHVAQAERWGLLFWPAYLGAGLWVWLHGGRPYLDNPFEVAARHPSEGRSAS